VSTAVDDTKHWFESMVLGLGLCPFAAPVHKAKRIRYSSCHPDNVQELLTHLLQECQLLERKPHWSTSLLIYPGLFPDFSSYLDVLYAAEAHLKKHHFEGTFQLASFHPNYCFQDCDPSDPANATNQSPHPMLHILREEELSFALDNYANPEQIPLRNMARCRSLGWENLPNRLPS